MSKLQWNEKYSVGIDKIDEQHKKLIDIINKSYDALENNDNSELGAIIDEILDYTDYHFNFEEKLLQEFNYPDLEAHKKKHMEYKEKMQGFKEQFESSEMFFRPKLIQSVLTWLRTHILDVDMKYSEYLKQEKKI